MLEKLTQIMSNPIVALISLISALLGIIGVLCDLLWHWKDKERKEFSRFVKTRNLIEKKKSAYEKLEITYAGNQIDDLCVSRVTIWNSGNKVLYKEDMVEDRKLKIFVSGESKILDVDLLASTEKANKFNYNLIDDQTVIIDFDYAAKKDGIVLQIIHTGAENDLQFDCKIKGGFPPKKSRIRLFSSRFIITALVMTIFAIIMNSCNDWLNVTLSSPLYLTLSSLAICIILVGSFYCGKAFNAKELTNSAPQKLLSYSDLED